MLLGGWVGVLLRNCGSFFLTSELRDFPMLQGNQGYKRVAAHCPRVPTHPLAIHPNQGGVHPPSPGSRQWEGGRRLRSVSCYAVWAANSLLTRDPWPDLPF